MLRAIACGALVALTFSIPAQADSARAPAHDPGQQGIPAQQKMATQPKTLTLQEAMRLSLQRHPSLRVFPLREQALRGEARSQSLGQPLSLGIDLDNVAGTGDAAGFDQAELTLALSSVLELGGKREARQAVSAAQINQLTVERQIQALDLLGEVTRRFVEVTAAQQRRELARDDEALAAEALRLVRQRATAGAAPDADVVRAKAAQAQARLTLAAAQSGWEAAKVRLAASWGDTRPDFGLVAGNLYALGEAGDFESLYARASDHPSIHLFASQTRLREAELRLAQTQSSTDISWTGGIKHLRDSGDSALVAGISIPLATGRRNRGAVEAALAARDQVAVEREAALLQLRDQLQAAFEQRRQALALANGLRQDVLPLLEQALAETRTAYERGRYSYLEWVGARTELLNARRTLIEAATAAQRARADIEQLTAQPLSSPSDTLSAPAE